MPRRKTPTLKGLFVNSHIDRLREEKGEAAVQELERRFGGRVVFRNLEDVPVRDEVRIIGLCLELSDPVRAQSLTHLHEAGRLHFRNFAQTGLGQVLLSSLPHTPAGFRTLVLNSRSIGRSIFKNTNFTTSERGRSIIITMENTDYPLEHFAGFFGAWAEEYGIRPDLMSAEAVGHTHRYTFTLS